MIKAGSSRVITSASGMETRTWSRSLSVVNKPGADSRKSPKEIFTAPLESWARILSSGTDTA
jgi:hypothetical protein